MAKKELSLLDWTRKTLKSRLTKLALTYIKARYPSGIAADGRIYLSLTVIKDTEDEHIHCSINNEYDQEIGEGLDVEFPLEEWWNIDLDKVNAHE